VAAAMVGGCVAADADPDAPADVAALVPAAGVPGAEVAALPQPEITRLMIAMRVNRAVARRW